MTDGLVEDPALTFTRELREQIGNEAGAQFKMSALLKCVQGAIKAQGLVVVPAADLEEMVFLYCWKAEGMNTEQARIHAKARVRSMIAASGEG